MGTGLLIAPLAFFVRAFLALVFLSAAVEKARHRESLVGVLENYRLLPAWAATPASVLLPAAEAVTGVALVFAPRWGGPASAALLAIFAAAMGINLHRGRRRIDCGCGQGALRQTLSGSLVARNVVLAVAGLWAAASGGPAEPDLLIVAGFAALVLFVLYRAMNALWALGPIPRRRRIRVLGAST